MPKILIVAEQSEGQLKRSTFSAVTFAQEEISKGGGSFAFVAIGSGISGVVAGLQGFGAEKIYSIDAPGLANYTAEAYAVAVDAAARAYGAETVVTTATTFGKDILPRVAARLGAGMASDITGVSGVHQYKRPMWAGNVIAEIKVTTPIAVVSVRGATFEQAAPAGGNSPVESLAVSLPAPKTRFVEFKKTVSARPELTEARVVVSGGRGV
jgi:electron transfer flavoprotein alpha subunit